MTNYERQEQHLNDLYELMERKANDPKWVAEVELAVGRETGELYEEDGEYVLGTGALDKAEELLTWEIAETAYWIETYAENEREYADYRHMVEVESRYW